MTVIIRLLLELGILRYMNIVYNNVRAIWDVKTFFEVCFVESEFGFAQGMACTSE